MQHGSLDEYIICADTQLFKSLVTGNILTKTLKTNIVYLEVISGKIDKCWTCCCVNTFYDNNRFPINQVKIDETKRKR